MHGLEGGEVNESTRVVEESLANIGATIMGRNMFGGHPGAWDARQPWNGWWGSNPPYHHPVFVLTHHPRPLLTLEGGNSFTFVTDGIESALEQARRAARGKDVSLAGRAKAAQQYLKVGLVDKMKSARPPRCSAPASDCSKGSRTSTVSGRCGRSPPRMSPISSSFGFSAYPALGRFPCPTRSDS